MEMADYWIEEKQLIHKLFKVLVPRYNDYKTSYTMLYRAPKAYPDIVYPRSVLELKGLFNSLGALTLTIILLTEYNI